MVGSGKSEEVIQKIIENKDKFVCVRGNRENYIIEGLPLVIHDEKIKVSQEQIDRNEWIKSNLSKESIKFIKDLPKDYILEISGKKIYMCHYPMDENKKFKKHIRFANLKENEEMFKDIDADIFLYGHTHANIYNRNISKYYINPGSLGCPMDTDKAHYGILEIAEGDIKYNQFYVNYNVKEVIKNIEKLSFPGYKDVLKAFFFVPK